MLDLPHAARLFRRRRLLYGSILLLHHFAFEAAFMIDELLERRLRQLLQLRDQLVLGDAFLQRDIRDRFVGLQLLLQIFHRQADDFGYFIERRVDAQPAAAMLAAGTAGTEAVSASAAEVREARLFHGLLRLLGCFLLSRRGLLRSQLARFHLLVDFFLQHPW